MFVIGITGSLGSGKTTVANMFRRKGAKILDADKIAHGFLVPGTLCFKQIVKCFGSAILAKGHIDRARLAKIVFDNENQLKKLCRIVHPEVIKRIKAQVRIFRAKKNKYSLILDAPLLFEAGLDTICDYVIVVRAGQKVQIARIQKRSHWTQSEILKRMKAQMPMNKKVARANFVIDNQGNINQTRKGVEALWQELKKTRK